ncbi:MAG: iron ABC transporter permease [Lachnospiraceae bacterium]|nr:iron ABC transporter permease [Lachnospiraceae bacterium]
MKKNVSSDKKTSVFHTSLFFTAFIVLLAVLIFSMLAAVTFGNADISLREVYSVIGYELFKLDRFSSFADGAVHDVVWLIRFPRVLLALAVGMGLSVCGVVMQAIVKNPLADPYILGVSSGASLGATLAIMIGVGSFLGGNFVGIMAFAGALITSFAVMIISNMGGSANAGKLILTGTAVSAVCSAFSSFVLYIANDKGASAEVMYWTMGSLAGANWERTLIILPVILICTLIFWTQYRNLNLMLLGDEVSITLGTDLHKSRTIYLVLSSVIVGFAVYSAGMIGFVGLIIPHVIRILFGTDHKHLLPLAALLGSIFLIWSDVACRIILKNSEMPIGILVSIIGAPCFIYLLVKRAYGFGGGKS